MKLDVLETRHWTPRSIKARQTANLLKPQKMKTTYCSCDGLQSLTSDHLPSVQIRELVPESQAYMDLLAFERKLDQTIMRKRVDIQEALKRPMKVRAG